LTKRIKKLESSSSSSSSSDSESDSKKVKKVKKEKKKKAKKSKKKDKKKLIATPTVPDIVSTNFRNQLTGSFTAASNGKKLIFSQSKNPRNYSVEPYQSNAGSGQPSERTPGSNIYEKRSYSIDRNGNYTNF
jgi:hypothetical protein